MPVNGGSLAPNSVRMAAASAVSLSRLPVPCALIRATSAGFSPASVSAMSITLRMALPSGEALVV